MTLNRCEHKAPPRLSVLHALTCAMHAAGMGHQEAQSLATQFGKP
ncbi:MAG TPA: hypothetical protein VMF89_01470 [Polyangiales bacterium]|nr:hypothetical protein [Polyangiales bacterium]